MKILLDEGVPRTIQKRLSSFSTLSVEEMGWRGIKNGALLDLMTGDFQILVTTDKNLSSQQNLKKRQISVVILPTNRIPIVMALLPLIEQAFGTLAPGEFVELSMPLR